MTYAIDARWMSGPLRGMGKFAHTLIEPIRDQVILLHPDRVAIQSRVSRLANSLPPYWEQTTLPRLCRELGVETLICPYNTAPLRLPQNVKLILVVHDLIFLERWRKLPPSGPLYQTLGRIYRRQVVPRIIARADRIITVSKFTRDEILQRFQLRSAIEVIPNSVPDDWFIDKPLPLDERRPEILTVTGFSASKNLAGLFRAYALFASNLAPLHLPVPMLRVVGIADRMHHRVQAIARAHGIAPFVTLESYLSPDTLRDLYRHASLFISASLYEGFGIPIIESMASGTPVLCSKTTSQPELLDGHGWYFEPRDPRDIARSLTAAWQNTALRNRFAREGLARARRYSRRTISGRILDFWNKH